MRYRNRETGEVVEVSVMPQENSILVRVENPHHNHWQDLLDHIFMATYEPIEDTDDE